MTYFPKPFQFLLLWMGTCPCFVHAQTTPQDSVTLHQIDLSEIVVSVNREKHTKLQLPRQVWLLNQHAIAQTNAASMSELLLSSGALTVQKSQQGGGSPILRGFEASRVLLQVDGVRMNHLIYRTGHLQNAITVDQNMLERVEVLFGPASLHYGSDALGGTILFHTKKPNLKKESSEEKQLGHYFVRYGSAQNEITSHLDFQLKGKKMASLTSLTYSSFGDPQGGKQRNPFLPTDDSYIHLKKYVVRQEGVDQILENQKKQLQKGAGYTQYDLLQKIRFQPNRQEEHLLNFQFSNSSNINRYDRLTEMKGEQPKYASWYYGPQLRLMGAYEMNLKEELGADRASLILAYQKVKESRHNRRTFDEWLNHRLEEVDMFSLRTDWIKSIHQHTLHTGIDGTLSFAHSKAYGENLLTAMRQPISTRYAPGGNQMHQLEGYLTHVWKASSQTTLHNGIRLGYSHLMADFQHTDFYPFLSGKVIQQNLTYSAACGINYLPSSHWKLALNLASGFRVPNIDDLAKVFDSQAGMVVVPNPHIQPEQTLTTDLNLTYHLDEHFVWENIGYATYYFNAITLAPSHLNGQDSILYDGVLSQIYTSKNAQRAFITGISSRIKMEIGNHFMVEGNISYTYGRILKKENLTPLDHIPPLYGKINIGYQGVNHKLQIDCYALFNGRKKKKDYNLEGEDNINYATVLGINGKGMPAWFTLNLKGNYRLHPLLSIQCGIENILDTEYRLFASGIQAPGRNISLTLRSTF